MVITRDDIAQRVAKILERPARWASASHGLGDYDGRERTLEVFNAAACDQRALLRTLRPHRSDLEQAAGGPLIIIFHTPSETRRLYADVVSGGRSKYGELADAMRRWMTESHVGHTALEATEIERFTFGTDEAA